jgi:hypothetical protein
MAVEIRNSTGPGVFGNLFDLPLSSVIGLERNAKTSVLSILFVLIILQVNVIFVNL